MMNTLPGYLLNECIYEGTNTIIYRTLKQSDFSTVIIKTNKAEYPSLDEVTRLRHEYKILKTLSKVKGIVKAYS
ncbi:MAG: hypothetical protein N4J56_004946 [Chroococcidiopsis sp. SAG 2025]|uniref:hypothetical protein n=1 Tax=Chroococcidiopsis sp. SAG 2025 TaxID=171389 RepID=UPI002936DECE|nr:hypothetical protein [Chroococcidiopsis sp. SAG 2025]MDV2995292.1 hypothetical protein [Chroococcidiopsis sp. SAG 2025]